jgi:hypothetical protein
MAMAQPNYDQTHGVIPVGPLLQNGNPRPINLNTLVNMEIVPYPLSPIRYYKLREEFISFYIRFLDADGKHDFYSDRGGDSRFRTNLVMDMLHRTSFGQVNNHCMPNNGTYWGTQRNPLYQNNDVINTRINIQPVHSVGAFLLFNVNDHYNTNNFKFLTQEQYNGFHNLTRRGQVFQNAVENNLEIMNGNLLLYTQKTFVREEEIILAAGLFNPQNHQYLNLPHLFPANPHRNGVLYIISGTIGKEKLINLLNHLEQNWITIVQPVVDQHYRSNLVQVNNHPIGLQDDDLHIIATKDTTNAGFARGHNNYGGINDLLQLQNRIFGINGRIDGNYVENQVSPGYYYFPDVSIYMTLFDDQRVLYGCIYMVKWFKSVGMNNIDTVTRIFFITLIKNNQQLTDIQWLYANQDIAFQQAMTIGLNQVNPSTPGQQTQNASYGGINFDHDYPNIVNDVCFMDTLPPTIGPEVTEYKTFCNSAQIEYQNHNNPAGQNYLALNNIRIGTNYYIILNQLRRCARAIYNHLLPQNLPAGYTPREFIIAFLLRYKQKGDESHATDAIQLESTIQNPSIKSIVCTNDQYLEKLLLNLNQSYVISSTSQRTFYFAPKRLPQPLPQKRPKPDKQSESEKKKAKNDTKSETKSVPKRGQDEDMSKMKRIRALGGGMSLMNQVVEISTSLQTTINRMERNNSTPMVSVILHDLKNGFLKDYSLDKIIKEIKKHVLNKSSLTELDVYNFKYHVVTSIDRRQRFTFREVIIEIVIALNNIIGTFDTTISTTGEPQPDRLQGVLDLEFDITLDNYEDNIKKLIEVCSIDYNENDPEDYTPFDINLSIIQHWLETINIYRELTLREQLIQLLILRARWILSLNRNNDYDGIETESEIELRNILNPCLNQLLEENKSPIPRRRFFSLSTLSNLFSGGNSKKTKKRIKSTNKNYKRKVQTRRLINQTSKNKRKNKTQNIRYN